MSGRQPVPAYQLEGQQGKKRPPERRAMNSLASKKRTGGRPHAFVVIALEPLKGHGYGAEDRVDGVNPRVAGELDN